MTPSRKFWVVAIVVATSWVSIRPAYCADKAPSDTIDISSIQSERATRYLMVPPPSLHMETAMADVHEFPEMPVPAMHVVAIAPVKQVRLQERPALPRKTYFTLTLLGHSGAAFDSWSTRRLIARGGEEVNPFVKPYADSAAIYPVMQAWPLAMDYVGRRMARSDKPWVRRMWWLPQTLTAAASWVNGFRNVSLANSVPAR
jgi:hypothetical protein